MAQKAATQKSPGDLSSFRKELIAHLTEGHAHATYEAAVKDFPANLRGVKSHDLPHSAYQLIEHLRIAQWDILEYALDPNHKSPEFPDGYWPKSPEPLDSKAWDASIASFKKDSDKLVAALEHADVLAPIPHAGNQSLASKTILLIDHNSYHVGQLILLRRLLGAWSDK
jgi:hypothetical protein